MSIIMIIIIILIIIVIICLLHKNKQIYEPFKSYDSLLPDRNYNEKILTNPDNDDVVDYDDYECVKITPFNKSVLDKQAMTDSIRVYDLQKQQEQLQKNSNHNNKSNTINNNNDNKDNVNISNKKLRNNINDDYKIISMYNDGMVFDYKKINIPKNIILNDEITKGYNLENYYQFGNIKNIGRIKLNNNHTRYPKPSNYKY